MRSRNRLAIFGLIVVLCFMLAGCYEDPSIVLVQKPEVKNTSFVYDGTEKSLTIRYVPDLVELSGTQSATDAGTYFVTASLKDKTSFHWEDGSYGDVVFSWTIDKAKVTIPSVKEKRKYMGEELSSGAATTDLYIASGEVSAKAVGAYEVRLSLLDKENTEWEDSTTRDKTIPWSIIPNDLSDVEFISTFEYDGKMHNITADLPNGVVMTSSSEGRIYSGEEKVTVTLSSSDPSYYLPWKTKEFNLVVNPLRIVISSFDELNERLHDSVNFNKYSASSVIYELGCDVNGEGNKWEPVGSYFRPFMAEINGNGYKIENLVIDNESTNVPTEYSFWQTYAFFGAVADGARIENIEFSNINVNAYPQVYTLDKESLLRVENYAFSILVGTVTISDIKNNSAGISYDLFWQDRANSEIVIKDVTLSDCTLTITESDPDAKPGEAKPTGKKAFIGGLLGYESFGDKDKAIREGITINNLNINISANETDRFLIGAVSGAVNATPAWWDSDYAKYKDIEVNGGAITVKRSAGLNNTFIGGFFGNIGSKANSGQETIYAIVDLIDSTSSIDISAVDKTGNHISIGGSQGGNQMVGSSKPFQLNAVNSSYSGKVERGE